MSDYSYLNPFAPAAETPARGAGADADGALPDFDPSFEQRLIRRPLPALDVVGERLVRNLRPGLFQMVRRSPEIALEPIQVQRFCEFTAALPAPASFDIVSMQPLRGGALVVCEGSLVSVLVEALYGGAGRLPSAIEGRDFSPAEQRVIQRLVRLVCAEYNKAWQDLYPLALAPERSETHLQFVNIAAPAEMVIAMSLRVAIAGFEGGLHVCVPYAAFEPIREVLYGAQQARALERDRRWLALLTREIQAAEVALTAELGRPRLTVGQLLAMQPGDFIAFERPARVVAAVDGTPLFACEYGVHNARYALRIDEHLCATHEPHWLAGDPEDGN